MLRRQCQDALLARGAHPARTTGRGLVMSDQSQESFEERSRALFHDSVEGLDFALRSRLTQARNAAVDAASAGHRPWFSRIGAWTPAAGVTRPAVPRAVRCLGGRFW